MRAPARTHTIPSNTDNPHQPSPQQKLAFCAKTQIHECTTTQPPAPEAPDGEPCEPAGCDTTRCASGAWPSAESRQPKKSITSSRFLKEDRTSGTICSRCAVCATWTRPARTRASFALRKRDWTDGLSMEPAARGAVARQAMAGMC